MASDRTGTLSTTDRQVLELLAVMFQGAIDALEWGDGRALEVLAARVAASSQLTCIGEGDGVAPWQPLADGRSAHLVIIGGTAPQAAVAVGWLLLKPAGVLVLREGALNGGAEGALPRGAFTVRISDPASVAGTAVVLACKDPSLGEPIATALAARLPRTLVVEAQAPAGTPAARRPLASQAPARIDVGPDRHAAEPRPPTPTPSCVFINTYYKAFLDSHYRRQPQLAQAPYQQQKDALQARCFGDSDFYSRGLAQAGWRADDLIVNCEPLQVAWARENGVAVTSLLDIALEQLRRLRPNVIYLQDLSLADAALMQRLRPLADLVAGQIASPLPPQHDPRQLDLLFTSLPHFAERFREQGVTAYYQPLAFEPRVLERVPETARVHPVTFIGGFSEVHIKGIELVERICKDVPLRIWGYGADRLPADSLIRTHHRGEAWGDDMFALLRQSQITINRHGDFAEDFANNMRLYEATGCGALLVTDHKDNLDDLFDIGKEVVAYRSAEECVALVHYYLAHPDEAARIARAGQQRTLTSHSYARRMQDTADILASHLARKHDQDRLRGADLGEISTGHTPIAREAVTPGLVRAWKDESLPRKQRALVNGELGGMYRGQTATPMQVMARALAPALARRRAPTSVLEVGCSSGYYREVFRYLLGQPFADPAAYTGVDYAPAMIAMAKDHYPRGNFLVADGARLPFPGRSFDVAISSCVILHTPNWQEQLAETVRVAREQVVVHRTPICRRRPTSFQRKRGYGVDMVELVFNEQELLELFGRLELQVDEQLQYHANPGADEYAVTYVCRRQGGAAR